MSTKNLKFIHLASSASAQHSDANVGAIIFEPKSGRIAVDGASGIEYYGGGRIADATFDTNSKILEISFNDGITPAIKLDFSDTASAEGVNAIMKAHADRISALETTVGKAAADGKPATGLVKAVADNTSNIAKNATAINSNKGAIDAINNVDTGILAQAKKYTDDEIVELRGGADGYTGTLKGLDGRITSNTTNITNLQELHADGGIHNGKKSVAEEINEKAGADITGTVQEYVEGKVATINSDATKLSARVTTLETVVGGENSGLVKQVKDNEAKLNTLIGTDTGKSARTIANEELVKQLIPENAIESLDTLQEIAAWIQAHPGDAAAMNTAIGNLQTSVGTAGATADANGSVYARIAKNAADITTNATAISNNATNISNNATAIDALKALHADTDDKTGKKTVKQEVDDGIKGLGTVTKTNDEGDPKTADVVVTVTTTEGKVSAVGVDASVLDGKVTAEKNRAEGEETKIRADLGKKDDAASTAATATAFGRIKALEEAQSSGALMWSDWQD